MGRMLVFLLGAAVVLGGAWYYVTGGYVNEALGESPPKRTLSNVRGAADRIEEDAQKRVDTLLDEAQR